MKKQIILLLLLIVAVTTTKAQKNSGFNFYSDRDVYISGETMLAKVYTPLDNPSRIVYLDLVNPHGIRITGISLQVKENQADGFLELPDSLSSGTYLIRAYQKNTEGKLKTIREVWISNRFDEMGKAGHLNRLDGLEKINDRLTDQIDIEDIASEYRINSAITSQIKIEKSLLNEIDGNLLVSIAQIEPSFVGSSFKWTSDHGKEGWTEDKGIILSGTITDKKTSVPLTGATVYLTIPDSIPGFQYYVTRTDGRFYFLLNNYFGPIEAFIQCYSTSQTQRPKIKMDELFAPPGTSPKFTQQPIPEEFKKSIARNIDAITFQKIFAQDKFRTLNLKKEKQNLYPYYGEPTKTVNPQLFIDLPNFNEISKELLSGVKFRNYNNEPTLQVINSATRLFFEEKPLLLIDGIPVNDLNVIKNMGTKDIARIDICQNERFYGNLRFPGVVAIYSTKADYSILHESDQLIHLKLEAFQLPVALAEPSIPEPSIPDLRQVIYWNPSTIPSESFGVKCYTSTVTGTFKLVIRGRLKDGTIIFSEKQFEVK
jgi:hypothetical protein